MKLDCSSIRLRTIVMLGAIVLPASQLLSQDASFDAQLQYLRTQNVAQVGRDSLVEAYDKLITNHPDDPRVAEAMLEIAKLFNLEIPELDTHPDREKALVWLQKAAATAVEGSPTWIKTQFRTAGYLQRSNPQEARKILDNIAAKAKDKSSLLLARIEHEFQNICMGERDLDAAEYHCRRLLGWYADPERIPNIELEKAEIDYLMISAGASMVAQFSQAYQWPVKKRVDRIVKLMKDYGASAALYRHGQAALKSIREMEKQEYKHALNQIKSLRKSLKPGPINDLKSFEKFADEIQTMWSRKSKEYYALLMLELCEPLSSGRFNEERQFALARKYALLGLAKPNQISLETELELTGHVITDMVTPRAPKGQEWAQQRRKDVQIRLHAWKRLIDSIDPNWDLNERLRSPNAVGVDMGLPGAVAPEAIKDPKLRAEYEAALQTNRDKIERYTKQSSLRKWLKKFKPRAERYIVRAYSKPPFNLQELRQYLDKYIADKKTKDKILDAVKKNMEKQTKDIPEGSKQQNR
jgi:hypothetical protein